MSDNEVWRPVPSVPAYEVSNHGRVRNATTERVLRLQPTTRGYLQVNLGAANRNRLVHRLVCEAFHGEPPTPGAHADHLDFDRTHNAPHNLRWLPAHLNLGRQVRWGRRGWEVEEEAPADVQVLTPEEREAIGKQLEAQGW